MVGKSCGSDHRGSFNAPVSGCEYYSWSGRTARGSALPAKLKFQLDRDTNDGSHSGSRTVLEHLLFTLHGLLLLSVTIDY